MVKYTEILRRVRSGSAQSSIERNWLKSTTALRSGLAVALLAASAPHPVQALPQGGTVVSGNVTITQVGNQLKVVETSSKAVINWQSYSIATNETVTYYQPDGRAIILNRVLGGGVSRIDGRLGANGQIWISNPSGIVFGPNATVTVGGLIATTHDLTVEKFNAGTYQFKSDGQPAGIVENQGSITVADAGLAAFVAPGVVNHGVITARLGEVTLAAGNEFTVDLYGDQKINLAMDRKVAATVRGGDGKALDALVKNDGKIFADGGSVRITAAAAKGLVDNVISVGGVVQARSVQESNGEIILSGDGGAVQVAGTLDASGAATGRSGGSVAVSGNRVTVKSGARIDVSGAAGGGQALIGGDFRGGNATAAEYASYALRPAHKPLPPAEAATVEAGAVITADALTSGRGGEVIVWSDGATAVHGTLSARGGAEGGNGGFIETSGHQLNIAGIAATTKAAKGTSGTWLIDPTDFVIAANNGDMTGADLSNALDNNSVSIVSDGGSGGTNGDIIVNDAVSWSQNTTLTLNATRNVQVNANITASGANAGLVVQYGADGNLLTGGGASITLSGVNAALTINGNSYTLLDSVSALQGMGTSGYWALRNTINAGGAANFTPIGDATTNFTGTLEGLGHSISGLTINRSTTDSSGDATGLIGVLGNGGLVRNVRLVGGSVAGHVAVGALVGRIDGGQSTFNYTAIVVNSSASTRVSGYSNVGGLVGGMSNGAGVYDSSASGAVTGFADTGSTSGTGGLVGSAGSYSIVSGSHASGRVAGGSASGGLIGYNAYDYVIGSYATGPVSGTNNVGGLIGYNDYAAHVQLSYASGAISGTNAVGGLVGKNDGGGNGGSSGIGSDETVISDSYALGDVSGVSEVGGLVGANLLYGSRPAHISTSYSTGAVSGASSTGGLVGFNYDDATVTNSYWDTTTSGKTTSAGGSGLGTADMMVLTNLAGFDPGVWYNIDARTRPFLRIEYSTTITNAHQLQLMSLDSTASYTLANDISMSELGQDSGVWSTATGFVPIGYNSGTFTGAFDGAGHTISNLTIVQNGFQPTGMFEFNAGAISNFILQNATVTGSRSVGAAVGYNFGTVDSVYVQNGTVVGKAYSDGMSSGYSVAGNSVGGVVGYNSSGLGSTGSVNASYFTGTITATDSVTSTSLSQTYTAYSSDIGGLVGMNGGAVSNSYAYATINLSSGTSGSTQTVHTNGSSDAGGLVGMNSGSVSNSYALGTINGGSDSIGGLVGSNLGYSSALNNGQGGYVGGSVSNVFSGVAVNPGAKAKAVGVLVGNNGQITYLINGLINGSQTSPWIYGSVVNGIWISNLSLNAPHGISNSNGASADGDSNHVTNVNNSTLSGLLGSSSDSLGMLDFTTTWSKAPSGLPYLLALDNPCPGNTCVTAVSTAAPTTTTTTTTTTTSGQDTAKINSIINVLNNQTTIHNDVQSVPQSIGPPTDSSSSSGPMPVISTQSGTNSAPETPAATATTASAPPSGGENGGSPQTNTAPTNDTSGAGGGAASPAGGTQTASAAPASETGGATGGSSPSPAGGEGATSTTSGTSGGMTGGGQQSSTTANASTTATAAAPAASPVAATAAAPMVMVASVPVLTTPVAPTMTQLAQTPRVQQGVQTVSAALTAVSAGGNTVHDVVANMNTGATKLSMPEQKAVFSSIPTPKLVGGLLSSSNPVDKAVGGQLSQVAGGNVGLKYADIKAVLAKGGITGNTALTYLAMYQVVHKEAMTTLFKGALQELAANPQAADVAGISGSTPARGTRSVSGVTAAEGAAAAGSVISNEAFSHIVLPKVSLETDASGRVIIRGKIEKWQPGMDLSQRDIATKALQVASLEGGSIEVLLGTLPPRQVAEATSTKIEGWNGGRQVRISGRWIFVRDDGTFEVTLPAGTAMDTVKLTIVDEHGQVLEQTPEIQKAGTGGAGKASHSHKIALLFANSTYSQNGIPDLNTPTNDVARVSEALHNKLGFVTRVINNATKAEMIEAIGALHSESSESDQVFIYYAGHGYENERTGVGYWLPVDATTTSARNWMSTRDLAKLLRRVPAKNIMLVADSCYSGSFTKEQNFEAGSRAANLEELGSLRGVMAMSSGGDEPVMDGEVNSPFARALVDRVKEISATMAGEELYTKIKADVTANTPQTPQYGVISSAGYDPGADYLIRDNRSRVSVR